MHLLQQQKMHNAKRLIHILHSNDKTPRQNGKDKMGLKLSDTAKSCTFIIEYARDAIIRRVDLVCMSRVMG